MEVQSMLALYSRALMLLVFFQSTLLLKLWLIPIVLGQPFQKVCLLAEHKSVSIGYQHARNTRTTHTNPIVLRLAWIMPFHAEHYAFPAVPFYRLPTLHNTILRRYLQCTERGYAQLNKKYRGSLLKSGDETQP